MACQGVMSTTSTRGDTVRTGENLESLAWGVKKGGEPERGVIKKNSRRSDRERGLSVVGLLRRRGTVGTGARERGLGKKRRVQEGGRGGSADDLSAGEPLQPKGGGKVKKKPRPLSEGETT